MTIKSQLQKKALGGFIRIIAIAAILMMGTSLSLAGQATSPAPEESSKTTSNTDNGTSAAAEVEGASGDPLPQDNARLEQPPSEIEQWTARYESILGGLDDQSMTDEDVDRFYEELNVRLREKYKQIRIALTGLDRGQRVE